MLIGTKKAGLNAPGLFQYSFSKSFTNIDVAGFDRFHRKIAGPVSHAELRVTGGIRIVIEKVDLADLLRTGRVVLDGEIGRVDEIWIRRSPRGPAEENRIPSDVHAGDVEFKLIGFI